MGFAVDRGWWVCARSIKTRFLLLSLSFFSPSLHFSHLSQTQQHPLQACLTHLNPSLKPSSSLKDQNLSSKRQSGSPLNLIVSLLSLPSGQGLLTDTLVCYLLEVIIHVQACGINSTCCLFLPFFFFHLVYNPLTRFVLSLVFAVTTFLNTTSSMILNRNSLFVLECALQV